MESLADEASSTSSEESPEIISSSTELSQISFKLVSTKGDVPSPRANFSLSKFSSRKVFLYGGFDDKNDLNDSFVLDLVTMKWTQLDFSVKTPLVGHCSVCLNRSLSSSRPYIYIFGGWDGSGYSDKGILINPKNLETLISNYNDPVMDWSSSSKGSHPRSTTSDSPMMIKSNSVAPSTHSKKASNNSGVMSASANVGLRHASSVNPMNSSTSRKVTWFASVRSDRGKSDANLKKMFAEKVPFSRRDHTLTMDPETQKIYLYGGWNSFHWTFDESKFLEMWTLDSNWRWSKEALKGDIPQARRGHSTVCLEKQRLLIIYGGCSGYNAILEDCYQYDLQACTFTKIERDNERFYPEGRAWHNASVIGQFIYYYGGLRTDFKATSEIIAFDISKYKWHQLRFTNQQSLPQDMERYGHRSINILSSLLIFGGSTPEQEQNDEFGFKTSSDAERKISLQNLVILETDESNSFEKNLLSIQSSLEEREDEKVRQNDPKELIKPPPVPREFLNPQRLLDDQSNFLHWNPHIFPNEANKSKIQYFKQKAEEEARKSTLNTYSEFEGLEDEEFTSPSQSTRTLEQNKA